MKNNRLLKLSRWMLTYFFVFFIVLAITASRFMDSGNNPEKTDTVIILLPESIIGFAKELQGIRYKFGGTDRSGFDCSGFTRFVFKQLDVHLPRSSREQARVGKTIDKQDIRKADLLFFKGRNASSKYIGHVAIAVSDWEGNNVHFVHSATTGGVRIDSLNNPYYKTRYMGASRVVEQEQKSWILYTGLNKVKPQHKFPSQNPGSISIQRIP